MIKMDLLRTGGGEVGDKCRTYVTVTTSDTTVTRGEEDGDTASAKLAVSIAEVATNRISTQHFD